MFWIYVWRSPFLYKSNFEANNLLHLFLCIKIVANPNQNTKTWHICNKILEKFRTDLDDFKNILQICYWDVLLNYLWKFQKFAITAIVHVISILNTQSKLKRAKQQVWFVPTNLQRQFMTLELLEILSSVKTSGAQSEARRINPKQLQERRPEHCVVLEPGETLLEKKLPQLYSWEH